MKIAITGAEGQIGSLLRHALKDDYDLSLFTLTEQDFSSNIVDLSIKENTLNIFKDIDILIHLAGEANPRANWDSVLKNNIVMMHNILEECVNSKVKKIIFASTHHTQNASTMIDCVPGSFDPKKAIQKSTEMYPDSDSAYAASKIFGEQMGQIYHQKYGIHFIALRIGWVQVPEDPNPWLASKYVDYLKNYFLSQADCIRGFQAAITSSTPFLIAYLMSNNLNCSFSTKKTNKELNYRPKDTVEEIANKTKSMKGVNEK